MPAPSGTQWGAASGSGTNQGQIGIAITISNTDTLTTVTAEVWYRTMYSCYDSANSFWVDWDSYADTTPLGSIAINHPVSSGSGWSISNQTKIGSWTTSFYRQASAQTKYFSARFANVEAGGGSGSVAVAFTVPALPAYTISYNANGGTGAPTSQTKIYGQTLTLSSTRPTRTGYTFLGWATTSNAASAQYQPGGSFDLNQFTTLYAVWQRNVVTLTYDANGGKFGNGGNLLTKTYNYGDTVGMLETVTRDYYKFLEWNTSRYGEGQTLMSSTVLTQNVTVYAQWKVDAIVYVKDGGVWKRGIPYVKTDGAWKRGSIYAKDGGHWKRGVGQ